MGGHVGNGFGVPKREVLLKDRHVLVVHNFIETANPHEHKCNRHFRTLLARLRHIHSKDSWHSCTIDITSFTEVLTLDTLARSQFQLIFATELLGMVFACHEGTIGYDRLLLKDRHVWYKCDSHQRHQRNKTTWNSMEPNQSWINKQTFST